MSKHKDLYYQSLKGFHKAMQSGLMIFCYHGVSSVKSTGIENNSGKHISVDEFDKQMRFLANECNVLSMNEVVYHLESKTPFARNSVAITFDDGFANNFSDAAPVLRRYELPAMFYIAAGIVNTDMMFWVDELEDCINLTEQKKLSIQLEEKKYDFDLSSEQNKLFALNTVKAFCKKAPSFVKNAILKEVSEKTNVQADVSHCANYKKIKWREVKDLASDPLFLIGGHSSYHDILSNLPEDKMRKDIDICIDLLEYHIGQKVRHFSYPEGQNEHYNNSVIEALKDRDVVCSPSAISGVNTHTDDPFQLKRVMVGIFGIDFPFFDNRLV